MELTKKYVVIPRDLAEDLDTLLNVVPLGETGNLIKERLNKILEYIKQGEKDV